MLLVLLLQLPILQRTLLEDCQHKLNIKLEYKNRFLFTIIFDKKNRYIAWTGNSEDRPILKNLDGMSRKYPIWIKQQIEKIATPLITKSNVDDVISVVKRAFEDLDYGRFEVKHMQYTEQLDKHPNHYPNDKEIRVKVIREDIQLRLRISVLGKTSRYFGIK
jgi:DNA polymerase elongation subunit (family B)